MSEEPQTTEEKHKSKRAPRRKRAPSKKASSKDELVKTSSAEIREAQEARQNGPVADETPEASPPPASTSPSGKTLAEVVSKHTADDSPPIEEVAALVNAPEPANRQHTYSPASAVPPLEEDPLRRDAPTIGHVHVAPQAPELEVKAVPQSLEDLIAMFPIGMTPDGQYFIRVERKSPRKWQGMDCAGVMQPITEPVSYEEFRDVYGGGDYRLTVHGPPRRGGRIDPRTNLVIPARLTDPVQFTVPLPPFGVPPNAPEYDEEEDEDFAMPFPHRFHPPSGRRPASAADAKMFEAALSAEERAELRREQRMQRLEEERERDQQRMPTYISPILQTLQEKDARHLEMLAEQQREARERDQQRYEEERQARRDAEEKHRQMEEQRRLEEREEKRRREEEERERATRPSPAEELAKALAVLNPKNGKGDESLQHQLTLVQQQLTQQAESHRNEVTRLTEAHKGEMQRVYDSSQSELRREREAHEAALQRQSASANDMIERAERGRREAEERLGKMQSDFDRKLAEAIKAERELADKRIAEAEKGLTARLEDERRNNEREIRSLKDAHERELRSYKESTALQLQTEKSLAENTKVSLSSEITRERDRANRAEAEAKEKGDLAGQVEKFGAVAEQLGYAKGDGPQDWKSMLFQLGSTLFANVPDIVKNAGEAVAKSRETAFSREQIQAQHMAEMQAAAQQQAAAMAGIPPVPPPLPGRGGQPWQPPAQPWQPQGQQFATEDNPTGFESDPTQWSDPDPIFPDAPDMPDDGAGMQDYMGPQAQPPAQPQPAPQAQPQPQAPPRPPQPQAPPPAPPPAQPPAPQAQPQPQAPPRPPQPPAPQHAANPAQQVSYDDLEPAAQQQLKFGVESLRPVFEAAFAEELEPMEFAEGLLDQFSPQQIQGLVGSVSPELVTEVIGRLPNGDSSPLVRRDGRRWLQEVFAACAYLIQNPSR